MVNTYRRKERQGTVPCSVRATVLSVLQCWLGKCVWLPLLPRLGPDESLMSHLVRRLDDGRGFSRVRNIEYHHFQFYVALSPPVTRCSTEAESPPAYLMSSSPYTREERVGLTGVGACTVVE